METRINSAKTLKEYNNGVLIAYDILTGKEYRRLRRKNKNYKNYKNRV